jgi:alkylhydroperoxidase/carboxymuconolactone decarboxylase family protein YurZ
LTDEVLFGDVSRRPELSPRDRGLVTIAVLIATRKLGALEARAKRTRGDPHARAAGCAIRVRASPCLVVNQIGAVRAAVGIDLGQQQQI